MVALPEVTPVTSPKELTEAAGEPLIHEPPAEPLLANKTEEPTQTFDGPVIVPALPEGFTVKVKCATEGVALHPLAAIV